MKAIGPVRLAFPAVRTRLARGGAATWLGLALAHAVAFTGLAHCHYVVRPPTPQLWVVLDLVLATAIWPVARWYVARVVGPAWAGLGRAGRWGFAVLPAALGVFVARWWAGELADLLWLFSPAARPVLGVVLGAAHTVVLAAGYAGLLAAVVRTAPVSAAPAPAAAPWHPVGAAVTFALFLAAANAFAAWYVGRERTVYYHDYMFYWARSADLADAGRADPAAAWDRFRASVQREDYGLTPTVGPAAVMAAAGGGRLVYVLAVVNLYLAGVAVAGWLFVRAFAPGAGPLAAVLPAVLVLTSPPAWAPLLRGYLDVGGAALGILAVTAYLSRPAGELGWPRLLAVGGLLAAMVLFRRWYGYFAATFLLTAGLEAVVGAAIVLARGGEWLAAVGRLRPVLVVGAASGVILGSVAGPWVARVLWTDYAANLAAWRTDGSVADRAWVAVEVAGPGFVAAAAAGFLVLLACPGGRRPALYLVAMVPIMGSLFLRNQDLYQHHQYLFLPALVLLPGLALARVLTPAPGWVRGAVVAAVAAAGAAAMAAIFVPEAHHLFPRLRPAVPFWVSHPLVRDDLPELRRLLRDLDREAGRGPRVAVAASSKTINPTTLMAAARSLGEDLPGPDRFALLPEVDRWGGFPDGLFEAELVVVADPPQTHLAPAEQQAIVFIGECLLRGDGVGRAFDRLPGAYRLDGGVMVYVYRRARPIPEADLAAFAEKLRQAHPDRPGLFAPTPRARAGLAFPRAPVGG